jgi:hypothetical protein
VLLVVDPLVGHCNTYVFICVAMGTVAGMCKEHPVENIPLPFFFVELDKCETHVASVCPPFHPM